ncbi:MAG: hypothetical protein ACI8X5_000437 [Planctomycetota bacterium]|jgi:hypothetical protein
MGRVISTAISLLFCAASATADDVIFLAADTPSNPAESLRSFVEQELQGSFDLNCAVLTPDQQGHFAGIELLPEAELLVVFCDRYELTESDRVLVEDYVGKSQPVLVIGSGLHSFDHWPEFAMYYVGVTDLGTWSEQPAPSLGLLEAGKTHPILQGVDLSQLKAHGPLHRVTPVRGSALPLIEGQTSGVREAEPVAWTNNHIGSRYFVTTLGVPEDFAQPAFRTILKRAAFWCIGRRGLDGERVAPVVDESNSVSLFDGESLEGWSTHGGRYDGNARWTVEDGTIIGRQGPGKSGGLLYTNRPYKNFVLSFETKIDYPFDSGVFIRMVPRGGGKGIQVTLDYRPGGQIGGIYADGFLKEKKDSTDLLQRDEWNRVVVRCLGDDMHVTSWLNEKFLIDYEIPAGTEGFAAKGLIGIQVHGGADVSDTQRAMFRDLRIRELPDYDPELFSCDDLGTLTPTKAGKALGWKALFGGKDMDVWKMRPDSTGYLFHENGLVLPVAGGTGEILTKHEYRNFELRLDFKTARMSNSGLFLRAAPSGNPAFSGCEIQILDDFNWETVTNSTLSPHQFSGALYGAQAPMIKDALRPLGDWNTYLIRYVGSQISVRLNGQLLYDVDTFELEATPPFAERVTKGSIGLQRHAPGGEQDEYAEFRNFMVREIEAQD